ncbi:hypothetical protein AJ88_47905 [Mesorhizobium amorphae CCBAU 01583]|nr:hypothetical protein AJ88_47905 [Mesorhizobium amorphae CCBAU 01583]
MFDPKKLLDDLLGSQIPGTSGTVRDKAGQAVQMAKDNPLAAGALAAVLLGTGAGRQVTGTAVKLGGLAAIGGSPTRLTRITRPATRRRKRLPPASRNCCRRPPTPLSIRRRRRKARTNSR